MGKSKQRKMNWKAAIQSPGFAAAAQYIMRFYFGRVESAICICDLPAVSAQRIGNGMYFPRAKFQKRGRTI